MSSDFRQCSAIRPDGERCKRVAREGSEFCHAHRHAQTEEPGRPEPLPAGLLAKVDASAWGFCEFCGDAYPLFELWPDSDKRLACRSCWFRADVVQIRLLTDYEVFQAAWARGLGMEAATAELLEAGYRMQKMPHCVVFVKKEGSA